jgi:ABC-2 type transport system ATP-binding protein
LRKVFRTRKRTPGTLGALRSFFSGQYEDRVAVRDVTFALEPGELVGYIGPNGAGKSTTIKMLTGILVPTSGDVRVAGLVPWKQRKENARNIGVVFGQRSQLYWDLPLIESFELLRAIYGVPPDEYRRNLNEFVEILEMAGFMRTPVRQL